MIGLSNKAEGITGEPEVSAEARLRSGQRRGQTNTGLAVAVIAVLFLIYAYSVLFVPQQRPDKPLMVTISDDSGYTTLPDTEFTEDYDYDSLWDKRVQFVDTPRSSDYSSTYEAVTIELEFETAREIDGYLGNQSMPNVVRGFAMYFLDQYINTSVSNPERFEEIPAGKGLGGDFSSEVRYDVENDWGLGMFDGIYVSKTFSGKKIFEIRIDVGEIMSNNRAGYPDNPVFKVVHWKAPKR